MSEVYLELEKIKNTLEEILGSLPDNCKEWEKIENLLSTLEEITKSWPPR